MSKKILITGGTGFIGRHVINELLKRKYEIHLIVSTINNHLPTSLYQHKLDLMDIKCLNTFMSDYKFDKLIHLAWYTGAKCHSSNINIDWTISTLNLLSQFKMNGGQVFLGAGSVSEYDFSYGYLIENKTPLNSPSLYGQSKASIYKIGEIFCKQNFLDFKWARIFNLYGPNEKSSRLMPSVINAMLNNDNVKVSDCVKIQDYLHVFDTASAIVDLLESKVNGAVNICSGIPIKLRVIVEKIAEMTSFKGNILWGAIPTSFDEPFVVGNNQKLVEQVGWKQKISLDEGLKLTIDWWKNNNV